ncbi:MAG: glycosyltransferase [Candidatus Hydrogenedentes bacterium]|nr:glycosyltransferase [Candidatus Hydrogenedentota bacterium]
MSEVRPDISIVVPVYNEAPNLDRLHRELTEAMEAYGRPYEIIAVDDGSRDDSFAMLKGLHQGDPRLRVVRLARNFGQNPAMYAGFERARGDIVVSIDADLQNPPAEIPKLIEKLGEGYDVVQGWREQRQDNVLRRGASRAINSVVSRILRTEVKDLGCGLKAYRREVIERLLLSRHHSRYLPAETAWLGAKVGEVKVEHRSRELGESKYGVIALLRVNFDMLASVSTAPVQIIGLIGGLFSLIGFAMAVRITILRILWGNFNDLAMVAALFFILAGVQMICTAVLCEYISRIYKEVQDRPYYIVGEVLDE